MCGIAVELRFDGAPASVDAVRAMTEAQHSRGPDGAGAWAAGAFALGHRRLSIIDLTAAGNQPMVDDATGVAVAFNGCIYNHHELRRTLQSEGIRFSSVSDTEVVLRAYLRWGEDFVDRLVGMFAIAIADVRDDRLVLVRDRLGIKPVYVAEAPRRVRVASSLPALLAAGDVDTGVDREALHNYLSWHSIVPAPRTILRGVRKLPPATIRIYDRDGSSRDRVYWQAEYVRDTAHAGMDVTEWEHAFEASLREAVRRRLVADVPVGVLLSGGVDSSLIVALLADAGAADRLTTFSIGFDDVDSERGDEFFWSDLVARTYGTDHHRIRVPTHELVSQLEPTITAMTEPMGSHDVVAFHRLSREVAQHVKVVQSGQGADEVFAGYDFYQPLAGAPRESALDLFDRSFFDRSHEDMAEVLTPEYQLPYDASRALARQQLCRPGADTALDAVLRFDVHGLCVDDPVKRVDSMTMAWGLEARVPFLDQDVVTLAAACPPQLKLADGGKGILKRIARRVLPPELVDRPKGYFPVPALKQVSGPVFDLVRDALTSPAAKERALFQPAYVDRLLAEPNVHRTPSGASKLWQLGLLELWLQLHDIHPEES